MSVDTAARMQLAAQRDDDAWRDAARAALGDLDAALGARFDAGEAVQRLLKERTAGVDAVVIDAWSRCLGDADDAHLLATGGYGRGELFPYSDIDLLVLAEPEAQTRHAQALARFFALLWDAGLAAGHAVRSLAQCQQAARDDLTVVTALSEWRLLAGAQDAALRLARAIDAHSLWPPQQFFEAKRNEQHQRHARFNDTAYNLEPNLKEGPGGMRDLHTLTWMARRIHGVPGLQALVPLGVLGEDEYASLERERLALSRLRFGLHRVAGRREERLLFDLQKALAARVGLRDERADNLAVEQLMQGFYRSAATVLRINDRLLQRFEEQLEGELPPQPLDRDFVRRHGYLALREPGRLAGQPELMLRLFEVWAAHPDLRGLHSESARALAEALPNMPAYDRATSLLRAHFMDLLRGEHAVRSLKRMARLGLLGSYLPAFGKVSGRMQFDLFHVYTVDQHTLTVLDNIASFASADSAQRFSLAHEAWPRLRKPELLLLAGLFHDIAKGRGGDHCELGGQDAQTFCAAHGLAPADTALVVWLVREHLLMSVTAQRQDISDPDVINRFATRMGDREHLDYLYLLTVADIAGTGPKLWNAWKDRLLADLYSAARFALRRGLEHPVHGAERVDECRAAARERLRAQGMDDARIESVWADFPDESFLRYRPEQLVWQTRAIADHACNAPARNAPLVLVRPLAQGGAQALEVFVYARDSDGLFAAMAATLDRLGLNVLAARVVTARNGMSLDTFQVLATQLADAAPEEQAQTIRQRLTQVLSGPLDAVRPARRALPSHLRHFRVPVRVEFEPLGNGRTQLVLVCADRPGLLADVAQVFRTRQVRVHAARIATFGERVEDFFQLTDERDFALEREQALQELRVALVACVDGEQHAEKDR